MSEATDRTGPGRPGVVETHISTLFFTSDRVYKLLKPIATGFLDHRDRDRRLAAVVAELELNRRMAPDVYLGVADLREHDELVDRMLIMRRLPADRRLSTLVGDPAFDDHLRRVARVVAGFHAGLAPVTEPVPLATAVGLRGFWESSFTEIAPSVGTVIDSAEFTEVRDLAIGYLDHHDDLFDRRRAAGFVRDGHGDLIADDIFLLADGPRILDCLAFDAAYRTSDVLADIAFLVMDVERLAGRVRASRLMRWYREFSNEHHPGSLAHHYVAYRAHVRAKVALLRMRQGDAEGADLARRYHNQALEHLRRARPTLLLLGGAPGTGKSTIAEALADALNWWTLDSDTLRKDIRGVDHDDHRVAAHPDLYDPVTTDETYRLLTDHAARLLDDGESVILDATWSRAAHRELARAMAMRFGARVIEVECVLAPAVARERVAARNRSGTDASDATPAIAEQLAASRDAWPTATPVDTAGSVAATADRVLARLLER